MDKRRVLSDPVVVTTRLEELGVPIGALHDAIDAWSAAAAQATPFMPSGSANDWGWRSAVGAVREALSMVGDWVKRDPQNWPIMLDAGRGVIVTVASGDDATGQLELERQPRTKNRRGSVVKKFVREARSRQLSLFDAKNEPANDAGDKSIPWKPIADPWFLLVYWSPDIEPRAELSLAIGYDPKSSQISEWQERIIIPQRQDVTPPTGYDERASQDDEVEVIRR